MTKLFDLISKHGHKIAERRAFKADPELAKREAARRTKPGIVAGSAGPGGLQGMFDDMRAKDKYRPWWLKVSLHIHWWMDKHGPSATRSKIRWFRQRGKRGWADYDTWNFDTYLAKVIRDGVRHMNNIKHGWPGPPMTFEEWGQILSEISLGMQAHLDLSDFLKEDKPSDEDLLAARDLAFDHLKKYWGHLWD